MVEEYRQNYGKKLLSPPVLSNVDKIDSWRHDLQIWECVKDIDKKQQGAVIYLSLLDKVRNTCRDIAVADLNKDDGLNILINKLESLESLESYTSVKGSNIQLNNCQSFECNAITKSEACKKLRRGIRAKTRTVASLTYEPGDILYFKQENSNLWKGPHTVIGRENKQILVKYGETYLRVHVC